MNYFVGLDLSLTGTGLIILNENKEINHQKLISSDSKDIIENRLIYIVKQFEFVYNLNPISINIEGISFGSKGSKMAELAALHYFTRICFKLNLPNYLDIIHIIPPTSLKKYITGTGRCQKNLMLLNVYKKYGIEFNNDNLADAYSLARMSLEIYNKNKEKTK